MDIKVRDALSLVEGIDVKISVTERYLLNSTLIPQGCPLDEVAGYTEGLSKALKVLNTLYTEKFSIMSAVNAKLAVAVLEIGDVEKTYTMLSLDLERVEARLKFLDSYVTVASKADIEFADKENYVSALAAADLLNDLYALVNIKCSLEKQINDLCAAVEIEVITPGAPPPPAQETEGTPEQVDIEEKKGDEESQEG